MLESSPKKKFEELRSLNLSASSDVTSVKYDFPMEIRYRERGSGVVVGLQKGVIAIPRNSFFVFSRSFQYF